MVSNGERNSTPTIAPEAPEPGPKTTSGRHLVGVRPENLGDNAGG